MWPGWVWSELGVVAPAGKPSTWEVKAERTIIQDLPLLHGELEASLGYLRPCLRKGGALVR